MSELSRIPLEQQTVRILSWHLVYGRSIPLIGTEGWHDLTESVDVPDFRNAQPEDLCPMAAFNDALRFIDGRVGEGDGNFVRQIGRNSAQGWGSQNRALVQQLQGKPKEMLEILLTQVHNWFLNDPLSSKIVESSPDFILSELDSDLHPEFDTGLIEGFAELVGAKAQVVRTGAKRCRISWS